MRFQRHTGWLNQHFEERSDNLAALLEGCESWGHFVMALTRSPLRTRNLA